MSLAHFWKIVMISSQPSEQYGFTTLFLFLLFLNSDIGIVILYIVKYIRKAFSLPKKINFEVQNLTNIHVFRFAFSDLYCYHTDLQNARNAVSDNLIFKISRGSMPPDPPSKERLRRSLVRIINWPHPPVKNPGYGPGSCSYDLEEELSSVGLSIVCKRTFLFSLQFQPILWVTTRERGYQYISKVCSNLIVVVIFYLYSFRLRSRENAVSPGFC